MPSGELPASPSEVGKVPERFSSAGEIISLASQLIGADQKRAIWRSDVERLWSGEPVYPLERLRTAGQAWRARTNYRGLEGVITTENTLDYDLETQGEGIVRVSLDIPNGQEREDWQQVIAEEFKWMMMCRWKGYNYHVNKRNHNKNLHGMGLHIWPHAHLGNWIPRTPNNGEVLFPDQCPFNFSEEGDYFMLRDFIPSYVLYHHIENPKQATDLGWDVEIVWKALTLIDKRTGRQNRYGSLGVDYLAKQYRDGDIGYYTTTQSGVWINSVFCREYESQKISQYSVAEGLDLNQYLYKKRDKYDDWPLKLFPYDIGTGSIHSVKGLGDRTKEFFEMMNRIQNSAADQIMLSSYPSMKQTVQNMDPDKMKLAKMGGLNWLPYGAEPQLIEFPDLNRGPLALLDVFQKGMVSNNRGTMAAGGIEQQDRMTANEYAMRAQDQNRLSTGAEAMQRSNLDEWYDRILRLAVQPSASKDMWAVIAREFRDRCMARGVPPQAFKAISEVKAVCAYGKGSASARINNYMMLYQSPAYQNASSDRQIAVDRGFVASMFGEDGVQQYCRSINDNDQVDTDMSFATVENDALAAGGEALAAPRQDQIKHLTIHFDKVNQLLDAWNQGQMEPQAVYQAIVPFGVHTKQHLNYLQTNPLKKKEFQSFYNQWQQLSRMANKLRSDIESAAQQQPPQQQVSEKLQIGLANVEAQKQIGMAKVQANAHIKMQGEAAKEFMEAQRVRSQEQRDNAQALHDMQLGTAETATTILHKTALTQADIAKKKATANA